ncbi:MAG: 2,3,4,5-tetrahydropyridine-2,6-dicarboxylate N-acetyltransferase [Emergencia sp.]
MNAEEIITYISQSEKKTPVKVYLRRKDGVPQLDFPGCSVFGAGDEIIFGDWKDIVPVLMSSSTQIEQLVVESDCRNSAVPLLDLKEIPARIEPGAIIRDHVQIGRNAVIMMGAVVNIGAIIGEESMIDMGAVLGGRAEVGKRCHIGAGAVLAGVIEPASAVPVVVEDDVMIGANAVVLEGVRIGSGSVVAAGAVVTEDVPPGCVAAGMPAKVIKRKDRGTVSKTEIIDALRKL